jgi:hypothetical protein
MPQEPQKKIEELLKAYGKKRTEDSGAPLEMHPATRKLFQAEVTRLRPKPASGSVPWFQSFLQFWPRIGVAISMVVVLGVIMWMLGSENRKSSQFAQAVRPPSVESVKSDDAISTEGLSKRETLDQYSNLERDARATDRLARPVEESKSRRAGRAPVTSNGEMLAEADAGKHFEKQVKLKEAGKSDPAAAPGEQLADALAPSTPAPVTDRQKNTPVLDAPAPVTQTLELARKPIGGAQSGGGIGGGAAQNSLGGNRAGDNSNDSKATRADSLRSLVAPVVTTNAVLAYSINSAPLGGVYQYSFQDSSGSSNALFGNTTNYYSLIQPAAPIDISANLSLFADGRANASALYFQQNQNGAWNEAAKGNKKVPELRAADSGSLTLARSERRIQQQPEAPKELSATFGVDKDRDGLSPQGQSTNGLVANWRFVAEGVQPAQAGQEVETAAVPPSAAQSTERSRYYQGGAKSGSASGPLAAPTVLHSFQMDLNGDRIRLTDADGSVYEGQLMPRNEEGVRKAAEAKAEREGLKRLEDTEKKQETLETRDTLIASHGEAKPTAFRVSGTNRSLNQLVVMDAVLSAPSGSRDEGALRRMTARLQTVDSRSAVTEPGRTASPVPLTPAPTSTVSAQKTSAIQTGARQSVILPTMKIQGKARIGGTNEININAIRVAP